MSYCYDIVLLLGAYNGQGYGLPDSQQDVPLTAIQQINKYIADNERNGEHCPLVRLTNYASSAYGTLGIDVYATVTNGLDIDGFLSAVQSANWNEIDNIQIVIKGQDDLTGKIYQVWRGRIVNTVIGDFVFHRQE